MGNLVKFKMIKKRTDPVHEINNTFSKHILIKILQFTGNRHRFQTVEILV